MNFMFTRGKLKMVRVTQSKQTNRINGSKGIIF